MKNNFNLVRLLLALTVMFSHSFALSNTLFKPEAIIPIRWGVGFGGLAVDMFFAVSGYLITISAVRAENVLVFSLHRVLRLVPALIVAVLFSNLAWSIYDGYAGNPLIIYNAPLWTLPFEALCYLCVGVLQMLGVLNKRNANLIFALLVAHYVIGMFDPAPTGTRTNTMLMFFLMGGFIAMNEDTINMKLAAALGAIVTVAVFTPAIYTPLFDLLRIILPGGLSDWRLHTAAYIFSAPFVVIYLGKYTRQFFALKTDLSYGVYIYAWPVGEIVMATAIKNGSHLNGYTAFLLALVPTFALAFLSAKLIEEPALRLKNFRFKKVFGPTGRKSATQEGLENAEELAVGANLRS